MSGTLPISLLLQMETNPDFNKKRPFKKTVAIDRTVSQKTASISTEKGFSFIGRGKQKQKLLKGSWASKE